MEHRITISTNNKVLIDKILDLLKDEDAVVKLEQHSPNEKLDLVELMNELSKGLKNATIQDPVSWQREIRKDRKLPFRDQ